MTLLPNYCHISICASELWRKCGNKGKCALASFLALTGELSG